MQFVKEDQKYFNSKYFNNNGQSGDRLALQFYFDILKNYLKDGKVFEFGCGEGYLSKRIATKFDSYAYDLSEYCRNKTKEISPKSTIINAEADFPSDSFNAVVTLHTLEHVPNPPETLALLNKSLKVGGILLFVVPNPNGLGHKIKREKWFGYRDTTHISMYESSKWKELVKSSGFEIVKTASDGFWDVPYVKYLPNILQKLIFFPSAGIQVILKRLFLPDWFGEDLIMVARKK
ncbi:MAG: class I SAM-dependent methyltransferase [Candidatus Dojkabacteria bacterium]